MPLDHWLAFVAAAAVLLAIPGPTVTLVIAYALGQGRKAAWATVAGVAMGDLTAMTASMLGLGALLAASSDLFTALRWIGAAYLVWLGIKLWRANPEVAAAEGAAPARRIFWHAYAVTALNPKSIVFFVAFVPQFVDASLPYAPQAAVLVATFVVMAAANAGVYAVAAGGARGAIRRPSVLRWLNRGGAVALIGAGAFAAFTRKAAA
jgi:threonine/homoserine/homoserine lactone efflux protein